MLQSLSFYFHTFKRFVHIFTGQLLTLIAQYSKNVLSHTHRGKPSMRLYEYLYRVFDGSLEDTDEDSNQSLEIQRMENSQVEEQTQETKDDFNLGSDEILENDANDTKNGESADKKIKRDESVDYKANTP